MRDRAEKVNTDLVAERAKEKRHKLQLEKERQNEDAPHTKLDHVYCESCEADYVARLHKHGNESLAYYLGKCPHGHTVRREITLRDRYYDKSKKVSAERELYADYLLTPNDARFKTVYPEKWAELEKARELRDSTTKHVG